MGLDFAEVMLTIEEKFGITIMSDDFDYSKKTTLVKDLCDIVERNTCKQAATILESQNFQDKIFDDVKQEFTEGLELSESDHWTRETTLRQLCERIPKIKRRWKRLRQQPATHSQKKIKDAVESKYPQRIMITCLGCLVFVSIPPILFGILFLWEYAFLIWLLFFLPGAYIWYNLWDWWIERTPPNITLGEIAKEIISQYRKSLKDDGSPYTREEIDEIVKKILCDELAIKPENITPEADLFRDLGMG